MSKLLTNDELIKQYKALVSRAWQVGNLDYLLHSGQKIMQKKINESKQKLFVVNVSRQFGKTFLEVKMGCEKARTTKNGVIKIATAYLTDLEEFILPAFDKVLEDCPEDLKPKYNVQKSKFIFPGTNAEIKLIGLDKKPDGLRGNTVDQIQLDECGFIKDLDYQYKSVIVPSTTHRPNAKIMMISTPPKSLDHPFALYCLKAKAQGNYHHATIYDNPMLTEEQIQEIIDVYGGTDSIEFRREYMAELITDKTKAIVPEWSQEFVKEIEETEFSRFYHRYVSMDIGFRDFTAVLFGQYVFKTGQIYIEDELDFTEAEVRTDKLQEAIKTKEQKIFGEINPKVRIADNNNLNLLQDLSSIHGLHFAPTSKDSLHAMVNELRMWVKMKRVIIHPRCKMLIGNLENALWNDKRDEFARSLVYKHFDHLAALIYMIRNIDQVTNPIPWNYGLSFETHHIGKDLKQEKTFAELKKAFNLK